MSLEDKLKNAKPSDWLTDIPKPYVPDTNVGKMVETESRND